MSCFICGRGNCTPMFHSIEEQSFFDKAGQAYERFLEIRAQCAAEYSDAMQEQQEEPEEDDEQ